MSRSLLETSGGTIPSLDARARSAVGRAPVGGLLPGVPLPRRAVLQRLGIAAAAALFEGCTPLRIAAGLYPEPDREVAEGALRAFMEAVIPGALREDPNLVRVFFDPYYPFARYRSWFVWDLDRRARRLSGGRPYQDLDLESRMRVVQDGLGSCDGATVRVYDGAIFLAHVAFYAGIYDDERGCPLIHFEGASGLLPPEQQTYPVPGRFLAAAATADGNPP